MEKFTNEITGPTGDKTSLSAQLIEKLGPAKFEAVLIAIKERTQTLIDVIKGNGQLNRMGKGLPIETRAEIAGALGKAREAVLNNKENSVAISAMRAAREEGVADPEVLELIRRIATKYAAQHLQMEIGRTDESGHSAEDYSSVSNSLDAQ